MPGAAATQFIVDPSDLARYRGVMKMLGRNVMQPDKFLAAAGEILMHEVMEAFKNERDPNTMEPWEDLKDSTKAGRKKGRKKAVHKVGAMGIGRGAPSRHAFARGVFKSGGNKGLMGESAYKILQDIGTLRGSFVRQFSRVPPAVAVGSTCDYAVYHQSNAPRRSNLPRRRMLPEGLTPRISAKLTRAVVAQIRANGVGRYVR